MQSLHQTESGETIARAAARERGLVMILVMAGLLLVLIIGLSYMEVVRQDRMATSGLIRGNDIDLVARAVQDLVMSKIKGDLGLDPANDTNSEFFKVEGDGDGVIEERYDAPGPLDLWLAGSAPVAGVMAASRLTGTGALTVTIADANGASQGAAAAADADGDAILDSLPEPAPIPSLRGRDYYMWVRVVDNASMLNLNVATGVASALNTYGGDPAYWSSPAGLDLSNFVFAHLGVPGDVTALFGDRGVTGGPAVPLANRIAFWDSAGRYYGGYPSPFKMLGVDAEIDLRVRNGVNPKELASPLESVVMNFTRQVHADTEVMWSQAHYVTNKASKFTTPALFFADEWRHKVTLKSGAVQHAPRLTGDPTTKLVKRDINQWVTTPNAALLAAEIKKAYAVGTPTFPKSAVAHTADSFAEQFAANIIDYADADNLLTEVTGVSGTRYGMEALPFISEVYAQAEYMIAGGGTDNGDGTWSITWERQGVSGFVVEIRNPFRKPVSLDNIDFVVNGVNWGKLQTVAGGKTTLAPDEVLLLYQTANGAAADGPGNPENNDVTEQIDTTVGGYTYTQVAAVNGANAWPALDGSVVVELRPYKTGGTALGFAYSATDSALGMPDTIADGAYAAGADPAGTQGWRYGVSIGNGNGINAMTVTPAQFAAVVQTTPGTFSPGPQLGKPVKAGGPGDAVAAPLASQIVFSDGGVTGISRINHIGELANIAAIGPRTGVTVGHEWHGPAAASAAADFMIDPASAAVAGTGELAVPHAIVLMDRLAAINVADINEQYLHGPININTVPAEVLSSILPIADTGVRTNVITALINYRNGAGRPAGHRAEVGFAHIGEVYNAVDVFGSDGVDNRLVGGMLADFISNPAADNSIADGITDDREERAMALRWLSGVATTRSDIFTAYILVRGYASGTTATPDVERRMLVIIDRSKIAKAGDSVEVLGVYQY